MSRTAFALTLGLLAGCLGPGRVAAQGVPAEAASSFLPLRVGEKWVLRNPHQQKPVIFEVIRQEEQTFVVRSTTPWNMSEWSLAPHGDQYRMTSYGVGGPMMPLPEQPVYLDFSQRAGSKWSNRLGTLLVVSRTTEVRAGGRSFGDCIQIRHKAGPNLLFTFARGVGYVQFGEGSQAFVLDESSSILPGQAGPPRPEAPRSAQLVAPPGLKTRILSTGAGPLIGITPNRYANEPLTVDVMTARFHQTLDAGATFLVGNGKWSEMESHEGQYSFENLQQFLSAAAGANLPISFTLRGIDTIAKDVPADLQRKPWSDPQLRARLIRLVDQLIPQLRGRARWFMFGYEIDGYLSQHPGDAAAFADLYRLVKARVKELAPEIQVSSTFTSKGLELLGGPLASLNEQLDFLAVTYSPLEADFTVEDPSVVPRDFERIREIAGGRKIVFQEVGYPTAAATRGSDELQAQFYRNVFTEIARDRSAFSAVNFMTLADLSDADSQQFASFYGLPHNSAFRGSLQSLGLFDANGHAKPSWEILENGIRDLRQAERR